MIDILKQIAVSAIITYQSEFVKVAVLNRYLKEAMISFFLSLPSS